MNAFVFVVTVMLNGVLQPNPMHMDALSDQCVHERAVLRGINRANQISGVDVVYFGECRQS
jgi:hypothetical protein